MQNTEYALYSLFYNDVDKILILKYFCGSPMSNENSNVINKGEIISQSQLNLKTASP